MTDNRTAVLILGMHRSGTSTVTGLLSLLGIDLPTKMMPANDFNAKGYFESLEVCKLNDDILASGKSIWHDWQSFDSSWFQSDRANEFYDRAQEVLLREYGHSPLFLLKDPRICRLLPFWLRVLERAGIALSIVQIHRNPLEVAKSLQGRDGLHEQLGQLLWLQHVLSAERFTRGINRTFISYDRLLSNWQPELNKVRQSIGLNLPHQADQITAAIEGFLSPSLRHYLNPKESVLAGVSASKWVADTYLTLEKWSVHGEDPEQRATLDRISNEFNNAAPNFKQVVELAQTFFRKSIEQEKEISTIKGELQEFRQPPDSSKLGVDVVTDRCDELLNELSLIGKRLHTSGQQLSGLQQTCDALRGASP